MRDSALTGGGPSQQQQESSDILTQFNFLLSAVNVSKDTFENEGSMAARGQTVGLDRKGKEGWSVTEAESNFKAEAAAQSDVCTTGHLTKALF